MRLTGTTPDARMPDLSLQGWLSRLESQHPVEIELGLDRVAEVARVMGLLRAPPPTFTVAGTNGKGSVVAVLSAALQGAGLRVGCYTSPHLICFNERICIDGAQVDDQALIDAFVAIEGARGPVSLSYFEVATLAALWLFRERSVDVQVLEVGLGGRLDAVNILDADVSVVTSIGLDHTDWLGSDRSQIAIEKAGVARPGRPCIVADIDPPDSLLADLHQRAVDTRLIGRDWRVEEGRLHTASGATYRMPDIDGLLSENIAAALQALEAGRQIDLTQAVIDKLSAVRVPGRLSRRDVGPVEVILDVAHNVESVSRLVQFMGSHPVSGRTFAVFGVMGDKPIRDMLAACIGAFDEWNLVDLSHVPRAMPTADLARMLHPESVVGDHGPFSDIWDSIKMRSRAGDRVVVFGSFFSVGEALSVLEAEYHSGERG